MTLFSEPLATLSAYLEEAEQRGCLRQFFYRAGAAWPERPSLVLQDDTGLELGGAAGSAFLTLWTVDEGLVVSGRVSIAGPELRESGDRALPLLQAILVQGAFNDEFETCQVLRDQILAFSPQEVALRFRPDRQKIWCRVSRDALAAGFDLYRYGCAIIKRLSALPAVKAVEAIFSTEPLAENTLPALAAAQVQDTTDVLIKIFEDLHFDCESCDYRQVCEAVGSLKDLHRRVYEEKGGER